MELNKISKYLVSRWNGHFQDVSRHKKIDDLRRYLITCFKGQGYKSIGIYVKVAEIPDNLCNDEILRIVSQIEKDFEIKNNDENARTK